MARLHIPSEHGHGTGPVKQARGGRTPLRAAWHYLTRALLALALILFVAIALLPALGLYRPVTVLSGSMRPTFSPGDMVVLKPEPLSSVRVGQVISYQVPTGIHQVETHRVVKVTGPASEPTVQTRGDANNANDPWTATLHGATAWQQVAVIPKLGYLVNAMRSPTMHMVAAILAPLVLALLVIAEIWGIGGRRRESEDRPAGMLGAETQSA
jgi:signal peptidase I